MSNSIPVCTCADICVAYVTRKGKRRYASTYGHKCWPIKDSRSCTLHGKKAKIPSQFVTGPMLEKNV